MTVVADHGTVSSKEVCAGTGLTYRRLHFLVTKGLIVSLTEGGYGVPFRFEADVIDRLRVARALEEVLPSALIGDVWVRIVGDVMDGPAPSDTAGFVTWSTGRVRYWESTLDLVDGLLDLEAGVLIAPLHRTS